MTICTYADNFQLLSSNTILLYSWVRYAHASPDHSGSCRVKSRRLEVSAGALNRLRRLPAAVWRSSVSSATAHAPGVGGIQLYGGPYGCVRAGLGLGSVTDLSFSFRGQILSVKRTFDSFKEADGVDITRRWDGSELIDRRDETGLGEFVRLEKVIDSGDGMMSDVKEPPCEGRDRGGGRRGLRLARSAPRIRTSIVLGFFRNPNLPL